MVLGLKTFGKGLLLGAKLVAGISVCTAAVTIGAAVGVAKAVIRPEAEHEAPTGETLQGCEPEMCEPHGRDGMRRGEEEAVESPDYY